MVRMISNYIALLESRGSTNPASDYVLFLLYAAVCNTDLANAAGLFTSEQQLIHVLKVIGRL